MPKRQTAPTPEVQYLPAVFRRIQKGDIKMPAFQRGFVWKPNQIIELLESIYRGFPIGSILLWRVERSILRVEDPEKSYFPETNELYPTHFVLDGLQRLSTLYAVFHFRADKHPAMFDVSFDLNANAFVRGEIATGRAVPLKSLFQPKEFLRTQQALAESKNGDALIDRAVELHSIFQEYMLPMVTIGDRDVNEVVSIFERVNNTGTKFGTVDFIRAVTWSENFDLNGQIAKLREYARERGFRIPNETLVKIFAISLGKVPTPESMLELRKLPTRELLRGTKHAVRTLEKVVDYLSTYLHVKSYALVPYEAQLLMLVRFFSEAGTPAESLLLKVARWFWTTSLNEEMQGRSEHQVARNVEEMARLRSGHKSALRFELKLTSETLMERRFRVGGALASAFSSMLAHRHCRSLFTGAEIPADDFMISDTGENFWRVVLGRTERQPKTIANTFVSADDDLSVAAKGGVGSAIKKLLESSDRKEARDILGSQFISIKAAEALMAGASRKFLLLRANDILEYARELAGGE